MKRFVCIGTILVLLGSITVYSQTPPPETDDATTTTTTASASTSSASERKSTFSQAIGVYLGYAQPNFFNHVEANDEDCFSRLYLHGAQIGLLYEATFIRGFGLALGANYTFGITNDGWTNYGKGVNYPIRGLEDPIDGVAQTMYHGLNVHLDLQYKFKIARQMYLGIFSGPALQAHFYLKDKTNGLTLDYLSDDLDAMGYEQQLNNLNVTWGVGLLYQYKRFFTRIGYNFGIISGYKNGTYCDTGYKDDVRLDQWEARVGVYFWHSHKKRSK